MSVLSKKHRIVVIFSMYVAFLRSFEMCAMECEAHNILHRLRGDILGPGRVRRPQCRWFSYSKRTSSYFIFLKIFFDDRQCLFTR